jgi:hypothetical protein
MPKTWTEKLQANNEPVIKKIDKAFADIPAEARMLIATPQIIAAYLKQVPKAVAVDTATIRKDLAMEYGAAYTCPVTTGIFLRIVAEAAYEQYQQQNTLRGITPFWRAIAPNTPLAKKLSFGQEWLIELRRKEGLDTPTKTKHK